MERELRVRAGGTLSFCVSSTNDMRDRSLLHNRRGVSLIEVLIGMVIVVIASIATLTYFSYGLGGIGKTGNRRAALERARERLEQLMASSIAQLPPKDGGCYACTTDPNDPTAVCTEVSWTAYGCGTAPPADIVPVEDQGTLRRETVAKFIDDPSAGTGGLDVYEFGVKVWFTDTTSDDDFSRVHVRTLRTP